MKKKINFFLKKTRQKKKLKSISSNTYLYQKTLTVSKTFKTFKSTCPQTLRCPLS